MTNTLLDIYNIENKIYEDIVHRSIKFIIINTSENIYDFIPQPCILKTIKNKKFTDTKKVEEKAPSDLKEYKPGWLYYAIYYAYNLNIAKNITNHNNKNISLILKVCIEFHKKFNEYWKEITDKSLKQSVNQVESKNKDITSCLKGETQFIVRMIEYLIFFSRTKKLTPFYFQNVTTAKELLIRFEHMLSNEHMHKKYYYIGYYLLFLKTDKLFDSYDDAQEKIEELKISNNSDRFYLISSSRQSTKSFNFTNNLLNDLFKYSNFIENGIYELSNATSDKNAKNDISTPQVTIPTQNRLLTKSNNLKSSKQNQKKITNNTDRTTRPRESTRSALEHSNRVIGNAKSQLNIIISASANNLKEKSYFESYYTTPYLLELKDLFQHIQVEQNSETERLLALFIFSLIIGSDLIQTINIINGVDKLKKSNGIKIEVTIDKTVFAQYDADNTFFDKPNYKIEYQLPLLLRKIYKYIQKNIDIYNQYEMRHNDKTNIFDINKLMKNELFDTYKKQININTKQLWKINLTHQQKLFNNIYTAMFAIAKYNKIDEAKIAYASTNTVNMAFSLAQVKYLDELDLNNTGKRIFDFTFDEIIEYPSVTNISGSFLSIKYDDITKFVNIMIRIINNTTNQDKRFNYISLYVRFCLTFLNGTRFYIKSSNINNISLENRIQVINEKAETNLSGIRLIGLCPTSIQLIKKYKQELSYIKYVNNIKEEEFDHFVKVKTKNGNFEKYKIELARYICKSLPYNKDRIFLEDFIESIPTNTGRHLFTKRYVDKNLNQNILETFLGHYIKGAEHMGIYSTLGIKNYKNKISEESQKIAMITGIRLWQ